MTTPHPTVDRDGRTFLAPVSSVSMEYSLPVDQEHLDSMDGLHYLLKDTLGNNYYNDTSFKHALARNSSRRKRVVDFGCSAGTWLREMAQEFPHVDFVGIDIVDAWDRLEDEPGNLEFIIGDLRERTSLADNSFDVVHIRHMRAVLDFTLLIKEAARILRPGGLLLTSDWGRNIGCENPQLDPSTYVPAVTQLVELLDEVIESHGAFVLAEDMVTPIRAAGHFVDDHSTRHPFSMHLTGDDDDLGVMGDLMILHFDSLRPLCKNRLTEEQLDDLRADAVYELQNKPGMVIYFYIATARKAGGEDGN